ncbi:XRE family transcriptional regulator [Nocardiopsis sp. LOL_012]|uniref:XRE family transcriptional regulator n=1 Tax=Nocardiopsis sp. LOL_012 TaxID=3345409 RepID=UPI003A89C455
MRGLDTPALGEGIAYRTEEEVIMAAARESARFGQRAEQTNVGPQTLEQLDADLRRLISAYPRRPVFPTFLEVLELRNRAFELLEGQQHPRQTRDLYLVAGTACGILSNASFDLGKMDAAGTQARTAYLCAELAGSNWLRIWVRGMQSMIAYWGDRFEEAIDLASSVRELTPEQGSSAVRLASVEARAQARLHNTEAALAAMTAATAAREAMTRPDDFGGMMAFPEEKQLFYSSTCQVWLGGESRFREAARNASEAVSVYQEAPPERRRIGEMCLARLDVASAHLGLGELEGAVQEIRSVFDAAALRRTDSVKRRLQQVEEQMGESRLRTAPLARDLRDEIIEFCAAPAPALPEGAAS